MSVRKPCHLILSLTADDRYPGPTLRALQLLQEERFRKDILVPAVVEEMIRQGFEAATAGMSR